jgi:hypothetical protein
MVLTVGAIPVSTGMGDVYMLIALMISATGQHMRSMLFSAQLHGLQSFSMFRQNHRAISGEKTLFELIDNRGEENHFFPPHCVSYVFTRVLMA